MPALLADEVIQTAGNYGYGLVDFMSIFSDMFDSPEVLSLLSLQL